MSLAKIRDSYVHVMHTCVMLIVFLFSVSKGRFRIILYLLIKERERLGLGSIYFLILDGFVTLVFYWFSLIFSSFVATALAFGCFSGAALVAKRREYLYLGGLLSSGLSILLWLHFASSIFGGSMAIFKFEVNGCQCFYFCRITFKLCFPTDISF